MSSIPYYTITSCCDQAVNTGTFNIPGSYVTGPNVYTYTGLTFIEPTTGMEFIQGYCYTVFPLGSTGTIYPNAFNSTDITYAGKNCAVSACVVCLPPLAPNITFSIYACCDAANVVTLNLDISGCVIPADNIWVYDGPGFISSNGFVFETGACYHVENILSGINPSGPACTDFTFTAFSECLTAEGRDCPVCDLELKYLQFTSCCDSNDVLFFKGMNNYNDYKGVRIYLGTPVDDLVNVCYSIIVGDVGDAVVPDVPTYNTLPEPPIYIEGVTFSTISTFETDCALFVAECPDCTPQCYTLYECDGEILNTITDLSGYVNSFITISNGGGPIVGTWFVTESSDPCDNASNDLIVNPITPAPCTPQCYNVQGDATITYLDYPLIITTAFSPLKFCSYIYPQITGTTFTIDTYGDCVFDDTTLACPELCFILTNCTTGEVINSNTQTLLDYISETVTLNGLDGCWEVTVNEGICDCPIPVTVLQNFPTCEECLPIVAYKLINCTNSVLVQYTYQDLSAYVGMSVELECGECWLVEQIDYAPPSVQVITVLFDFENCTACLRTYYRLIDCAGIEADIYTYTDLSTHVNDVIRLKDCDACWNVEETKDVVTPASIVSLESSYVSCAACLTAAPCVCSTIRNDATIPYVFEYTDCKGSVATLPRLDPGETSDRVCLISWSIEAKSVGYITYFGDCTFIADAYTCPPPVYPIRPVKPGYVTPACDNEKWDKITCKAAEILYKTVLKARYGISNCCDQPTDKWLVKKELIDLAALVDPNYICKPMSTCGCPTNSCGCGGSSPSKTCNS
jgi:hypothetical protein